MTSGRLDVLSWSADLAVALPATLRHAADQMAKRVSVGRDWSAFGPREDARRRKTIRSVE